MPKHCRHRVGRFLLATTVVALLAAGCCPAREASQPREESRLKKLGLLYGRFVGTHRGQPPKDDAEFREYVASLGPDELAAMDIQSTGDLFVSERDGQPYVIRFGDLQGAAIIAYEKVGVGGKRFVANNLGAVEEVDEARFRELVPPAAEP